MSTPCHISICGCTFARPQLLERLLTKVNHQVTDNCFSYSVVVVDSDPSQSARAVVESARANASFPIDYDVEPERNISLARNRPVRNAPKPPQAVSLQ